VAARSPMFRGESEEFVQSAIALVLVPSPCVRFVATVVRERECPRTRYAPSLPCLSPFEPRVLPK